MPPFLRFRLQLALLAMAMVAAPCSSPDEALDADLHFAMYAGGLDGFGEEPSFTLGEVGLQKGNQHMFALTEKPDFAIQERSFLSPNEARSSMTMANYDALHSNPVCPLQDHTGIFYGITNQNLSPVQGYSFPQHANSPPQNGRSHARNPFSNDGSSQVAYQSNQNNLIPALEKTTPTFLHDSGHNTLPANGDDTFHEIFEVIDSPGPGYDSLDPRQIHHNAFNTEEPLANPVKPIQNVHGIDSVQLYSPELPQENTQFIQGQEQISPGEDMTQSTAAYQQRTPPMPPCTSERQAATVHDFGEENPVYDVSAIDTGRAMPVMSISNANIFEDNLKNIPLDIQSQRVQKVIPRMETPFLKNRDHCIHCSSNVANNRQYLLQENLEMGLKEVNSDLTRQYKPSSSDESMDHQKQENNLSSIERNNSFKWIFPSLPAPPTNSQTPIKYTANVQRETKNILKRKSSTFPTITNTVQPHITTNQERVTDVKYPQEFDGQLQITNDQIQPLVYHQYGAQESLRSVQPLVHNQADVVQESPRSCQIQPKLNQQTSVQDSPGSTQTQLLVHHQAGVKESPRSFQTQSKFHEELSAQESPGSIQTKLFVHYASAKESPSSVHTQPLVHNQAGVQERPRDLQTQLLVNHQPSDQASQRSVQTQLLVNHQPGDQESQKSVQTQPIAHHQDGVKENQRSVQTPIVHNQAVVKESPRGVQIQPIARHQIGIQEGGSQRGVPTQSQFHQQAGAQESSMSVQTQLLVHQAGVQQSRISVSQPQLITRSKNDFQQRPILPKIYSIFNKDPNYLPTLKSTLGMREKVIAYEQASRSNVQEPNSQTPATYVPVVTRDIPPRTGPEMLMIPQRPVQAPGNPLLNTVNPEELILPPTLSEIPYDTFPYSESTDAEEKPTDAEQTPEDSTDCSDVRYKNTSRCVASNVTKPADEGGANGTVTVLIAPKVVKDVIVGNVTESDDRSKLKKKAKRRYEAARNNRTASGQEKSVAVTTVSRLGVTGATGGGDAGGAVQLCQCEPGKGCSCQSCSSRVKDLCRTVGLRVAEDVGEFVKKEAVSALKTLRDLKISA